MLCHMCMMTPLQWESNGTAHEATHPSEQQVQRWKTESMKITGEIDSHIL
jgi:hypothetical protein